MIPLLQGIRIVEIGAVVLGPYAGQILADLGADVIKIEAPGGDVARSVNRSPLPGMGAMYVNNNRNKKVIALDLKSDAGREIAMRLIGRSDVFLHNMRENAIERLGFGYEDVCAVNDSIIYCSAVGFGSDGPYAGRPAYDDVIQAASGIAGLGMAKGGAPELIPTVLTDKMAALYIVYGVLAALLGRERGVSGGQKIEAPMFECAVSFLMNEHLAGATFAENMGGVGYNRLLDENRRPHRTKDGWVVILPYTQKHWEKFLGEIGREDLTKEPWFQDPVERSNHIGALYSAVGQAAVLRTTREWEEVMNRLDIPGSRVNSMEDLLADPHLNQVGFFNTNADYPEDIARAIPQPVKFSGLAAEDDAPPAPLGADTVEVLKAHQYTEEEIALLIEEGVVLAQEQ